MNDMTAIVESIDREKLAEWILKDMDYAYAIWGQAGVDDVAADYTDSLNER